MATWRANAAIGLFGPGASGQIKPIFIDDYRITSKRASVPPFVSTAAIAVANGLCSLKRRTHKQQIRSRYPFKQASRRFGHEGYRLTNSVVDCLLTTQARQGAQPWKGNSSA